MTYRRIPRRYPSRELCVCSLQDGMGIFNLVLREHLRVLLALFCCLNCHLWVTCMVTCRSLLQVAPSVLPCHRALHVPASATAPLQDVTRALRTTERCE